MSTTNYTTPCGEYQLVRIKGRQAEILDPLVLSKILSILELQEGFEGQEGVRDLWDALYRSQPFHSTTSDPSGAHWREGRYFDRADNLPKHFPWAAQQNLL